MKCPRCGSLELQKKSIRAGKQRYRCKKCNANFCEGTKYLSAPVLEKLNISCLYCGSNQVIRDGKLPNGKQRYKCCSCEKGFSDSTVIKTPDPDRFCPYCGFKLWHSGYSKLGYKAYYCSSCHKSCTGNAEGIPQKRETFKNINKDLKCPSCGSNKIRLAGTREGKQRFSCKTCGRIFTEGTHIKRHSKKEIEQMVQAIFEGKSVAQVAQDFDTSKKNVNNIMKRNYYKEEVSTEKKKLIINYGYFLKVPLDYVAPYIRCSYKACQEVIKNFEDKIHNNF